MSKKLLNPNKMQPRKSSLFNSGNVAESLSNAEGNVQPLPRNGSKQVSGRISSPTEGGDSRHGSTGSVRQDRIPAERNSNGLGKNQSETAGGLGPRGSSDSLNLPKPERTRDQKTKEPNKLEKGLSPSGSAELISRIPPVTDETRLSGQAGSPGIVKTLESKTKSELVSITKKMMSEINIKNRIIHDIKINEQWMAAEIALNEHKPKKYDTELGQAVKSARLLDIDKKLISTLMHIKKEFEVCMDQVQKNETELVILEKKRIAAEEEAAYLRTVVESKNENSLKFAHSERVRELELQLQETLTDYTNLQSKVSQWAKTSKKNQEGRITAEAFAKVLEEDKQNLQKRLNIALRSAKVGEGTNSQIPSDVQQQISELEEELTVTSNELEDLKVEYQSIRAAFERQSAEKEDFQIKYDQAKIRAEELENKLASKNEYRHLSKKISEASLRNSSLSGNNETKKLQHNLQVLGQRFEELSREHEDTLAVNRQLKQDIEELSETNTELREKLHEQEELIHTVGELRIQNKNLQQLANTANSRLQSKQIALEVLQKHVEKAQEKVGSLQDAADDLDDVKDDLENERAANQDLLQKIKEYSDENNFYQQKIIELTKNKRKSNRTSVYYNEEIELLQEELESYKAENEMLSLQLEERTQDVELLEKQLNSAGGKNNARFSIAAGDDSDGEDNSKELQIATTKLAEQMIQLNHIEVELAEKQEIIETLSMEKAQLAQKLASLQKIKSDYEDLQGKYEDIQRSVGGESAQAQSVIDQLISEKEALKNDFETLQNQKNAILAQLEELDEVQEQLMAERATNEHLRQMLAK